jgi:hypothetical protein
MHAGGPPRRSRQAAPKADAPAAEAAVATEVEEGAVQGGGDDMQQD